MIDFHTHKPTAEGIITPRSFGIHPWQADDVEVNDRNLFFERYGKKLADAVIIGECGLDKLCDCSLQRQTELFRWQAEFAAELHKPMVIHCVRAFNEIIAIRNEIETHVEHKLRTWVIHGFTGGRELAAQLWKAGIWVSFGAAITDTRHEKVRNCLAKIETPFMLETDESDIGIAEIYHSAAEIRNCTIPELAKTIKVHFGSLVGVVV